MILQNKILHSKILKNNRILQWLLGGLLLCWMSIASAHQSSTAYLSMTAQSEAQPLTLTYRVALRDLALLLPLDHNQDQQITWQELSSQQVAFDRLLRDELRFSAAGVACDIQPSEPLLIEQVAGLTYVVQPLQTPCSSINQLDYRLLKTIDSNHRLLISRALPTGQTQNLLVAPAITELSIDEHSIWQTIRQFVLEGTHHLLIGADHLLFLFCILVPAVYQTRQTRKAQLIPVEQPMLALKQVIWVATAFTVAHSITLTLATLQWVQLPAQWVESVIAGSIVVAALMNLFGTHRRQVLLAFSFGLVHGFGFANVLSDLPLQPLERFTALLSFNLGIELGQLICILLFMPFALLLRYSSFYRWGVFAAGSALAAVIALLWMLQRIFEWNLIAG